MKVSEVRQGDIRVGCSLDGKKRHFVVVVVEFGLHIPLLRSLGL